MANMLRKGDNRISYREATRSSTDYTSPDRDETPSRMSAQADSDPADSARPRTPIARDLPKPQERNASTLSENQLSGSSDDGAGDGRFSVAEEVSLDMQSDKARRVGQLAQDTQGADAAGQVDANPADAMAKSLQADGQNAKEGTKLSQAVERSVPPSE